MTIEMAQLVEELRDQTTAMKEELDFADLIATGDAPLPKEYAACKDIGGF